MDGRPTWTDCDEAGDYVVPYVLSPRDLVFRPDNMDETVSHTPSCRKVLATMYVSRSGTKVLFICSKTGITVSKSGITTFFEFQNRNHRLPEKSPILNLNNFFSRYFKKILNGQKF